MMSWRQKEAHHRLLLWAEAEGRLKTVETVSEEERRLNSGAFSTGNTVGKDRYAGYRFGAGKGHKPQPHQVMTVKVKR